jgi:hypothetical protein
MQLVIRVQDRSLMQWVVAWKHLPVLCKVAVTLPLVEKPLWILCMMPVQMVTCQE